METEMFKSYLKIALRNIIKRKGYSFINIAGLALGMACFLLIVFYVRFERGFDGFHKGGKDVYLVIRENTGQGYKETKSITGAPLAPLLLQEFPSIERAARLTRFSGALVGSGEKRFVEKRFFFADGDLFNVFTFPLLKGDPETALKEPFSIILAPETAVRYFGGEDPMGRVLTYMSNGKKFDFKITGVLKKIPRNSHLQFDFLASYASLRAIAGDYFMTRHWDSATWTYVRLRRGTAPAELDRLLPEFTNRHVDKWSFASVSHKLMPLRDVYFHSPFPVAGLKGDTGLLGILSAIAAFILLIACVNFMNLSTASSGARAREIGLRKVVGADKALLVRQFLGETLVYSVISLVIAVGLVELLLPAFGRFVGRDIRIDYLKDWGNFLAMIATAVGVGLLAGSYPAFFLSAMKPHSVLKSRGQSARGVAAVRKILVTAQFAISIALIASVLLVTRQIRYIRAMDVGFDKEHVVTIPIRDKAVREKFELLKTRWLQDPTILSVTASSMEPGVDSPNGINLRAAGNEDIEAPIIYVDPDYAKTLGVPLVRGRDFSRAVASDPTGAVLINEAAAGKLGWKDGVGEPMELFFKEGGRKVPVAQTTVIGILRDFHIREMASGIQAVLFKIDPGRYSIALVRIAGRDVPAAIASLRSSWKEFGFDQPFESSFLEDDMNAVYRNLEDFGSVARYASIIAIFIACLGLFGLTTSTVESRTREIGVRKVLGASVPGVALLLSKDFAKWVLAANLIAWPAAYYFMKMFLRTFAYRVAISPLTFLLAGLLALAIALITVSGQTIKAALADPVDSLKYE
jgi:putative ABC transport system permease protein